MSASVRDCSRTKGLACCPAPPCCASCENVGLRSVLVQQPHPGSGRAVQAHVRADVSLELYWAHRGRALRVFREPLETAIAL